MNNDEKSSARIAAEVLFMIACILAFGFALILIRHWLGWGGIYD